MSEISYRDFTIKIEPPKDGAYPVIVTTPLAGQARGLFRLPFRRAELDSLIRLVGRSVRAEGDVRNLLPTESAENSFLTPAQIGSQLMQTLLSGSTKDLFHHCLGKIEDHEHEGLRIRLHLELGHPDLVALSRIPWELLYRNETREFVVQGRRCQLVRYLDVPRSVRPLALEPPLRILLVVSNPAGLPALDVERERCQIEEICHSDDRFMIAVLEKPTLSALRLALLETPYHVLHFIGHGDFDQKQRRGTLVLEDDRGLPQPFSGSGLATVLNDFRALRLVLLNACLTADHSEKGGDPFAGVATSLVLGGLPAVVAMQFPISDAAAIHFSSAFYRRLAAGDAIDSAVVEGRMAIFTAAPDSMEWVTPVLFLRTQDGRIFEPADSASELRRPSSTGVQSSIRDCSRFIEEKTEDFVGRRFIFDVVDRFIASHPRGYLFIQGDPGIGKSALLAQLVRERGEIHHFNIRAEGINRAEHFLANICAQLIDRYGLPYTSLPPEATEDGTFLSSLLAKISDQLGSGQQVIILIDALDEVDNSGMPVGVNSLFLPSSIQPSIYLVVTTRRFETRQPPLLITCEQMSFEIKQDDSDNIADAHELVTSKLGRPGLVEYLATQQISEQTFVTDLVAKSQGNFMYLRHVLSEIERGAYRDRSFDTIPAGLENYYEDHWRRMRRQDEDSWFDYRLPVLLALTVVKEPISVDLIARYASQYRRATLPIRVRPALAEWRQFLYETEVETTPGITEKRYRLYHGTFHDFIVKKDEVAEERIDLQAMHGAIADVLWDELFGDENGQ